MIDQSEASSIFARLPMIFVRNQHGSHNPNEAMGSVLI